MVELILLNLVSFYQKIFSPFLGVHCRFYPSCSQYAKEALQRQGALKGIGLAVRRLVRCQPFSAGGFDPVKK